jgi:hypothetical protein
VIRDGQKRRYDPLPPPDDEEGVDLHEERVDLHEQEPWEDDEYDEVDVDDL